MAAAGNFYQVQTLFCNINRSKCMILMHRREQNTIGCALRPKNVQNYGSRTVTSDRWHCYTDTLQSEKISEICFVLFQLQAQSAESEK
jgi:hypothetical protein